MATVKLKFDGWSADWEKLANDVASSWMTMPRLSMKYDELVQAARIGIMAGVNDWRASTAECKQGVDPDNGYLRACAFNEIRDTLPETAIWCTKHQNHRLRMAVAVNKGALSLVADNPGDSTTDATDVYHVAGGRAALIHISEGQAMEAALNYGCTFGRVDRPTDYEDKELLAAIAGGSGLPRTMKQSIPRRKVLALFWCVVEGEKDEDSAEKHGMTLRNMRYVRSLYRQLAKDIT